MLWDQLASPGHAPRRADPPTHESRPDGRAQVLRVDPYFASRYLCIAAEAEARQDPGRADGLYRALEDCLPLDPDQRAWLQSRRASLRPRDT